MFFSVVFAVLSVEVLEQGPRLAKLLPRRKEPLALPRSHRMPWSTAQVGSRHRVESDVVFGDVSKVQWLPPVLALQSMEEKKVGNGLVSSPLLLFFFVVQIDRFFV